VRLPADEGRMWTWTAVWCCVGIGTGSWEVDCGVAEPDVVLVVVVAVVVPLRQFARCWRRRLRTGDSSPGKRPTSPAHSLNPARNLFSTLGSVAADIATCWRCRFSRCFTVISKISAFSSFECLAG
jgi:hypothetical protein